MYKEAYLETKLSDLGFQVFITCINKTPFLSCFFRSWRGTEKKIFCFFKAKQQKVNSRIIHKSGYYFELASFSAQEDLNWYLLSKKENEKYCVTQFPVWYRIHPQNRQAFFWQLSVFTLKVKHSRSCRRADISPTLNKIKSPLSPDLRAHFI